MTKWKPLLYINPAAPEEIKRMFAETFYDIERVDPERIEEIVGGFTDGGPPLAAYAVALLDEKGELTVYEPMIPLQ
jgi:hypothetical protein